MKKICVLLFCISFLSCKQNDTNEINKTVVDDETTWRLGWRMIENNWNQKLELAGAQFDSLINKNVELRREFLIAGLEIKDMLGKIEEGESILKKQNPSMLRNICYKESLKKYQACKGIEKTKIENPELQLELIKMYVEDQATRGNVMQNVIDKYKIDRSLVEDFYGESTDETNRNLLKEIITEYGFPTRALVGDEAMQGVFLIIQHADGDKEWQKSQLPNIEASVKAGDMDGQSYAYLFDRIKINGGEPQRYGSQFGHVVREEGIAELADTEDIENLDNRRREMGMMPMEMYRRIMLKVR